MSLYLLAAHWLHSAGWQTLLSLAVGSYLLRYLYRSMRVVYTQSWARTLLKFGLLLFVYLVCGLIMLLATTLFSAVTV